MKFKYIVFLMILPLMPLLTSCNSFLDAYPTDQLTLNSFWKSEKEAEKALVEVYAASVSGLPMWDECMSDNAYLAHSWWGGEMQVANGTVTSYGVKPKSIWDSRYAAIRKCWFILENVDKVPFGTEKTKNIYIAEVRANLASNYQTLIAYFGDVPLVKKTLSVVESREVSRNSRADVLDFIIEQLDIAANILKDVDNSKVEKGHINWATCIAMKARTYLYENNYPKVLEQTELLKGAGYSLHTVGPTPYASLFDGTMEDNKEVIYSIVKGPEVGALSVGHSGNGAMLLKGMSGGDPYVGIFPTGSLVDSYPMADGRLINEDGSTYNPSQPYVNRDPRLDQSIVYPSGQMRYLDTESQTVKLRLYDPEDPTTVASQLYSANEPSRTGYMWNKYVDWSVYGLNQIWDCTNDIIVYRYADVLLMEAEALAETQGASAQSRICDIIDQLRNRCNGGNVHRENYTSKESLINLVRNERRVELANEGLRYFDIIRWKIAEADNIENKFGLKGKLYGAMMRLDGVGKDDEVILIDGVARRFVEMRYFDKSKQYLFPIPQDDRDLNPNLTQNANW